MNKYLLATTVVFALGGYAGAADLPAKVAPAPCNCTCDAAKFQGAYIGISGGGVKHIAHRTDLDEFLVDASTYVTEKWGGLVGGQFGWNVTSCRSFWGIELDGSWVGGTSNTLTLHPNSIFNQSVTSRMHAFLTARLRAGIAADNVLYYVTGGVAAARFRTTWQDFNNGLTPLDTVTFQEWRLGWTAGFGVEWAWTGNWTFKSEVLYANFTDRDRSHTFPSFGPASFRHSDEVWVARIGLNYKWGAAPVAARF